MYPNVPTWMRLSDQPFVSRGKGQTHQQMWTEEETATLVRLKAEGFTLGEIADELERTRQAVKQKLIRMRSGVKREKRYCRYCGVELVYNTKRKTRNKVYCSVEHRKAMR